VLPEICYRYVKLNHVGISSVTFALLLVWLDFVLRLGKLSHFYILQAVL